MNVNLDIILDGSGGGQGTGMSIEINNVSFALPRNLSSLGEGQNILTENTMKLYEIVSDNGVKQAVAIPLVVGCLYYHIASSSNYLTKNSYKLFKVQEVIPRGVIRTYNLLDNDWRTVVESLVENGTYIIIDSANATRRPTIFPLVSELYKEGYWYCTLDGVGNDRVLTLHPAGTSLVFKWLVHENTVTRASGATLTVSNDAPDTARLVNGDIWIEGLAPAMLINNQWIEI